MNISDLLLEALKEPVDSRCYWFDRRLRELFSDRAVLQTSELNCLPHATAEGYPVNLASNLHSEISTNYYPTYGIYRSDNQSWREIEWQGHKLDLILLSWDVAQGQTQKTCWILADTVETAESFLCTVTQWNSEVRGEILVFEHACWSKSEELYQSIKAATFENLILPEVQKAELQRDFGEFFRSREQYEQFGVPWKRGVLFYGPPGNGKTHTLKALINWLGVPCLYVKSFSAGRYDSEHRMIGMVFDRARTTLPCLLVLEDLDSLVNDGNRSFFLNELDGFASNTGIVIIATTNHPERLDPAIVNRPSRFDRKYEFVLPAYEERKSYLAGWSSRSRADLGVSDPDLDRVADLTNGFSYAYLKELWLSATMRWMESSLAGGMADSILEQIPILREQMIEPISEPSPNVDKDVDFY